MPGVNPLIHTTNPATGRGYVTEQAQEAAGAETAVIANRMPDYLAVGLVVAVVGLVALQKLGFRFVFEAGRMGK